MEEIQYISINLIDIISSNLLSGMGVVVHCSNNFDKKKVRRNIYLKIAQESRHWNPRSAQKLSCRIPSC